MKRVELVEAMRSIVQGVEKTSSPEAMDFVLIDEEWMRSFNDFISVSYPISTGLHCAVKADEFYRVLGKMEGEDVDVTDEGGTLVIKSGRTTVKLLKLTEDKLEIFKGKILALKTDGLNWLPITDEFSEGANFCLLSAAKVGRLEGVAFFQDNILSSDNARASKYVSGVDLGKFVLDNKVVADLLRISKDWKFVCKEGAWLHLKQDHNLVVSGKAWVGENYPVELVQKLFLLEKDRITYVFPEGLMKALGRAEVFAGSGELEGSSHLILKRVGEDLSVKGEKALVGTIEELIPWPEKAMPEKVVLKLSPSFLKRILNTSKEFSAGKKSMMFLTGNFSHMMVIHKVEI